jgi:hypothetical protein
MKLIIKSKNDIFKNGAIYNLDNFSIIEPAIKEIDDKKTYILQGYVGIICHNLIAFENEEDITAIFDYIIKVFTDKDNDVDAIVIDMDKFESGKYILVTDIINLVIRNYY